MLGYMGEHEIILVLVEVHKGACNNHIEGKALTHKLLREGYYWPTLMKDIIIFVKKCDKFQRHVGFHHALAELL